VKPLQILNSTILRRYEAGLNDRIDVTHGGVAQRDNISQVTPRLSDA
jgi:hypothetical protein